MSLARQRLNVDSTASSSSSSHLMANSSNPFSMLAPTGASVVNNNNNSNSIATHRVKHVKYGTEPMHATAYSSYTTNNGIYNSISIGKITNDHIFDQYISVKPRGKKQRTMAPPPPPPPPPQPQSSHSGHVALNSAQFHTGHSPDEAALASFNNFAYNFNYNFNNNNNISHMQAQQQALSVNRHHMVNFQLQQQQQQQPATQAHSAQPVMFPVGLTSSSSSASATPTTPTTPTMPTPPASTTTPSAAAAAVPASTKQQRRFDLATSRILANDELILNSVQLINFVDYYFDLDEQQQQPPATGANTHSCTKAAISPKSPTHQTSTSSSSSSPATSFTFNAANISICFPCMACSLAFKFDQTFHSHLDRRTTIIRFYCLKCQTAKTFYNKCKLLYHVYSHKSTSLLEPIYKRLRIEPISIERFALSKERPIDFDQIFATSSSSSSSSSFNFGYTITAHDQLEIKEFMRRLHHNKYMMYRCRICEALFFDRQALREHYLNSQQQQPQQQQQQHDNITGEVGGSSSERHAHVRHNYKAWKQHFVDSLLDESQFACLSDTADESAAATTTSTQFAQMLNNYSHKRLKFSTRCSTLAAMHLIKNNFELYDLVSPPLLPPQQQQQHRHNSTSTNIDDDPVLVCPECGLTFDSLTQMDNFRLHLVHECSFTTKYNCTRIRCPSSECRMLFDSIKETIAHWSNVHIVMQHKCELCHYSFDHDDGVDAVDIGDTTSTSTPYMPPTTLFDYSTHRHQQQQQQILDYNNNSSRNISNLDESCITSRAKIGLIHKHFASMHRGQAVSLMLVYKCMCRSRRGEARRSRPTTTTTTSCNSRVADDFFNDEQSELDAHAEHAEHQLNAFNDNECTFYTWNDCRKHILDLLATSVTSISCLICKKLIANDKYQMHLKNVHGFDQLCICPSCGPITE